MELTPRQIRDRAYAARISINKLLGHAGVSNTTLWRWETKGTEPHPVTLGRIEDALAHFEAEKAA